VILPIVSDRLTMLFDLKSHVAASVFASIVFDVVGIKCSVSDSIVMVQSFVTNTGAAVDVKWLENVAFICTENEVQA